MIRPNIFILLKDILAIVEERTTRKNKFSGELFSVFRIFIFENRLKEIAITKFHLIIHESPTNIWF